MRRANLVDSALDRSVILGFARIGLAAVTGATSGLGLATESRLNVLVHNAGSMPGVDRS
ncbi:MAG: hypothetical protein ACR2FG_00415 [Marmoricola sp.]